MNDIKITLVDVHKVGGKSEIIVDGKDLTHLTTGVTFNFTPGIFPKIVLNIEVFGKCDINTEGDIILNDVAVPEDIARQVYEKLKERFSE